MSNIILKVLQKLRVESSDGSLLADRSWRSSLQLFTKAIPMALRGFWWKIWLKKSGRITLIGKHVTIRNPQHISVGSSFVAEDYCEIQGLSAEGIVFGDKVTIGRFAMIRPSGYYGREIGTGLTIGDRSNIGAYCFIGCSGRISIGKNVLMSPGVNLFAENHNFERTDLPMKDQGVTKRPIIIEDDCWLASNSTILSGVHIGRGAIVAASAVVTKDVPPYAIVAGIPATIQSYRKVDSVI